MTANQRPVWRIEDVLARTDLADLLDQLAQPAMFATRGRRWHCPVPEHDDHHASVTIRTDHRGHERWRCWSGDDTHRGDAVDLVRVTQGLPRVEAVDWLADRAGMFPDRPLPELRPRPPRPSAIAAQLDPSVVRYVEACERILWGPTGRPVREWLHGRGFSDDLLRANRVGCDPGREMMNRQRGLPYGGSIGAVLPALDQRGDIAYVQTRYINPGTGPKYDNPAASLATNPKLAWCQTAARPTSSLLVVCEGLPDALTAAHLGHRAAAILGSQSATPDVAISLAGVARSSDLRVLIVNDHDPAGLAFSAALVNGLAGVGCTADCWQPPVHGFDLNDWSAQRGATPTDRRIERAGLV